MGEEASDVKVNRPPQKKNKKKQQKQTPTTFVLKSAILKVAIPNISINLYSVIMLC